jgi:hypothetical protein
MTVESIPFLSKSDARRLTQRIGLLLDAASGALDKLADAIRDARDGRADLALGYESWAEYAAAEFAPHTAGLTTAIRRELVSSLSVEVDGSPALSTRQIAPAVGVSHMAVQRDRDAGVTERYTSPDPRPAPPTYQPLDVTGWEDAEISDQQALDYETEELYRGDLAAWQERHPEVETTPAPRPAILGLDGKTYTRPEPTPRATQRRALVDTARDAGQELRKATERLERIAADDRLTRNKEEVAAHLRHHLNRAIEVCQNLDNLLNNHGTTTTEESTRVRTS